MNIALTTRRLFGAGFVVCALMYVDSVAAEEAKRTPGVLVSSGSTGSQPAAVPAPPKNKIRLRFVPKNPPPQDQARATASAASVSVASASFAQEIPAEKPVSTLTSEEEYALAHSRQKHPLAVQVEDASPVKQVVGSPKTIDYSTARSAYVLDPGRPIVSGGDGRIRPRSAANES